jgi:hypothetical protein
MSLFTFFMTETSRASATTWNDPALSSNGLKMVAAQVLNVLYSSKRELALGNAETFTLDLGGFSASEWTMVMLRVIGSARVNTTGTDSDGITAITGKLPVYGTSIFPGIGFISTKNVSSFVVESLADSTVIEILFGVCCADSDARMTTNA